MEADNIVIGSGPCGTIAAAALSALRQRTVVIDAGMSLDAARSAVIERLSKSNPEEWLG